MKYREDGSAAYDIFSLQQNTARPLERPDRLPQQPQRTKQKRPPKAKLAVSPFTLIGGCAALVLLFLVIFSYMRLYEAQSGVSSLKNEEEQLLLEQEGLKAQLEQGIDLDQIEARARQLGLREALPSQVIYVEVKAGDSTTVYECPQEGSILRRICVAFVSTWTDLVEYFS